MDGAVSGAAPYLRYAAEDRMTSRSVKATAIALALFALAVYIAYIVWIGVFL